jgi:phage recombination protein Bet
MSQELVAAENRFQPVCQQKRKFDDAEIAILRASYGKALDPMEFKVYVATASHLNLDPFSREIYALKYGTHPMTLITSIGGYRKMSARSGRYLGPTDGTLFVKTEQGQSLTVPHSQYDPDIHIEIISGTIGIRVLGYPEPVMATAVYKSNVQKVNGVPFENWKKRPDTMILKCAEAAAHRLAALFPDGAAAVYIEDEIQDYNAEPDDFGKAQPKQLEPAPVTPVAKPETAKKFKKPTRAVLDRVGKLTELELKNPPDEDTPDDIVVWSNSPIGKKFAEIEGFYRGLLKENAEPGWAFAMAMILKHFGVETPEEITDLEALRQFCTVDLLKELQQENFLPMTRR